VPITPPITPPPPLGYTIGDICVDALIEIGAVSPGEVPANDELQWTFRKANEVIDVWESLRRYVYSYQFLVFTFPVGINPVLLGPSNVANWSVPQRPVRLESAALILNSPSSTPVDIPINIRDKDWWALNQVKSISTNVPTDVYPDYTFPDASLYFWPVINAAYQCKIQIWTIVSQFVSITDPIGGPNGQSQMPPGLRTALKLTLAESLLAATNRPPSPVLIASAAAARYAFTGNNAKAPRIQTQDAGMPKGGKTKSDFNYYTGGRPGGAPQ
jgi:hypothetical protein